MTPLEKLTDAIDHLTGNRTHREPFTVVVGITSSTQDHVTYVASLIDQLALSIEPSGSTTGGHRAPTSRPSARLEAIDALLRIDTEATQWATALSVPPRHNLSGLLRGLVGAAANLDAGDPNLLLIARDARRWVTLAAVTTGWELPAVRLPNSCPLCAEKGSLRIRVGEGRSPYSFAEQTGRYAEAPCAACMETWDWNSIGLLAEHIRAENNDEQYDEGISA